MALARRSLKVRIRPERGLPVIGGNVDFESAAFSGDHHFDFLVRAADGAVSFARRVRATSASNGVAVCL